MEKISGKHVGIWFNNDSGKPEFISGKVVDDNFAFMSTAGGRETLTVETPKGKTEISIKKIIEARPDAPIDLF